MLYIILTILLIIIFLSLEIVKRTENYQNTNDKPIFIEDSIKIKGNLRIKFPDNVNKVKVNKLCIDDECITGDELNFVVNNKDLRNKLYCLGEACIDKRHMEILRGDRNFKLKHKNRGKCLNIRDLDIHGKPRWGREVHDDNDDGSQQFIPNAIHVNECSKDLKSMEFKLKRESHFNSDKDSGQGSVMQPGDDPRDRPLKPSSVPPYGKEPDILAPIYPPHSHIDELSS